MASGRRAEQQKVEPEAPPPPPMPTPRIATANGNGGNLGFEAQTACTEVKHDYFRVLTRKLGERAKVWSRRDVGR
jgi:hypothetical protein